MAVGGDGPGRPAAPGGRGARGARQPVAAPFGVPLALLAAVLGGGRVVYLALAALFEGSIGADIALAIACIAAACLGEYFVAAEVVFIALVGECLEALTFERAQRAIGKLLDFYPRTARVIRDDAEVDVPIERGGSGRSCRRSARRADQRRRSGRPRPVRRRSGGTDRREHAGRQGRRRPGLYRHGQPVRPAGNPGRQARRTRRRWAR